MKGELMSHKDDLKRGPTGRAIRGAGRRDCPLIIKIFFIAAILLAFLAGGASVGAEVLKGQAAFGDWHDDKPGVKRLLTTKDLPSPFDTKSAANPPVRVPMPSGSKPFVPKGFAVEMVTSGFAGPRAIRVAPNGDLFFADSMANTVRVLRVPAGSAKPSHNEVFAEGLHQPYGIGFYPPGPNPEWVYIANSNSVVRFRYRNGDLKATGEPEKVVGGIPSTHHWTRDIVFSPDGKRMFLSVGSGSNAAEDMFPQPHVASFPKPQAIDSLNTWIQTEPLGAAWDTEEGRANVLSFDPDGKDRKVIATGLRNCAGMTIQPATGRLWVVVNERDELGDNTPFEYATHIKEGSFYGWPCYYIGAHEDPQHKGARPDLKSNVTIPDVLMQAHSSPLQIVFYEGNDFPAEYKGAAFVTMHGSWNRARRTGYKVVRLLFDKDGAPTGEYEDFMTGFVISDKQVWGRPVGVAVAKDGSLFVTEDGPGVTIWRVSHERTGGR
jgi:glucose/arabinose dehydrogenase